MGQVGSVVHGVRMPLRTPSQPNSQSAGARQPATQPARCCPLKAHLRSAHLGDGAAEELEAAALAMLHRTVAVGGGRALEQVAAAGREFALWRAEVTAGTGKAKRRCQEQQRGELGRHPSYSFCGSVCSEISSRAAGFKRGANSSQLESDRVGVNCGCWQGRNLTTSRMWRNDGLKGSRLFKQRPPCSANCWLRTLALLPRSAWARWPMAYSLGWLLGTPGVSAPMRTT